MYSAAEQARRAKPAELATMLAAARRDTLAMFAVYENALANAGLAVPYRAELNPPLWELGHVGWFQDWWIGRFPEAQRRLGLRANPDAARLPPARAGADALYNSSQVPHAQRWRLSLPDADATRADLAAQLEQTLAALRQTADSAAADDDAALYFFRLALFHEDMHLEAAVYMAQSLGIALNGSRHAALQPPKMPSPPAELEMAGGAFVLGSAAPDAGPDGAPRSAHGFAFDNELRAHSVVLQPFRIDAQALRWEEFLPFIEEGGYADARHWSAAGLDWRGERRAPRYLQRDGSQWVQQRGPQPRVLDRREPACHLSAFEAQAWCHWAGRRLPTEAEWEYAALTSPQHFHWGAVWEWTASPFAPFAGFEAHPYRDYSQPWFDGRPVLKGASFGTSPRMRHPRYRNYFTADRTDIFAGLRSCAA